MEYIDLAQRNIYHTDYKTDYLLKVKNKYEGKSYYQGIKRPDTIEETTMNKGVQTIYEGMRGKMNKNFLEEKPFPHTNLNKQRDENVRKGQI